DWAYQVGGFALTDASRLPKLPALEKPSSSVKAPALPDGAPTARDAPQRYVVYAGRLYPVSGGPVEGGAILIEDGKIRYAGPRAGLAEVSAGTPALTAAVVTPGLIDSHSVVGLSGALNINPDQDQDETTDPNQADLRVLDGFNPNEPLLQYL